MTNYRSLNHTKWACQYHVVFIPKYRKKAIYGEWRGYLGEVLRRLAQQRESEVEEGHLLVDHVHMLLSIPPKHSVAQVIGYIKGKSAIHIAREFAGRPRNFVGQHFWARGYFVSTVGRDAQAIRTYIQDQELEDRRQDQLRLEGVWISLGLRAKGHDLLTISACEVRPKPGQPVALVEGA